MAEAQKQLTTWYITDGSLSNDRHDVEDEKNRVKGKWRTLEAEEEVTDMMCGNIRVWYKNNTARLGDYGNMNDSVFSFQQISSALALYRTISLFECGLSAKNVDFYKTNWEIVLRHKSTGMILSLGEWKGGFQIFTSFTRIEEVPAEYKKDAEELLTLLVSPTMTIGYDGTVAGMVA